MWHIVPKTSHTIFLQGVGREFAGSFVFTGRRHKAEVRPLGQDEALKGDPGGAACGTLNTKSYIRRPMA